MLKTQSMFGGVILLVEDNAINQEIAVELLQQRGIAVDVANNGVEAVQAVTNKVYDLVLMDIQMPIMDGFEATRQIRQIPGCSIQELPIVAMTAHAMGGDYENSLSAGMNDHITKPINPKQFYQTLRRWIYDEKKSDLPEVTVVQNASGGEELLSLLSDLVIGLSVENGIVNVNGNVELYLSILKKFEWQYRETAAKMQEALAFGNKEEAERIAHTVKGVSATLGLKPLSEIAGILEGAIKRGENTEAYWLRFSEELLSVCDALHHVFSKEENGSKKKELLPVDMRPDELSLIIEVLPGFVKNDLIQARDTIVRLGPIFKGTFCEDLFNALQKAVYNCDFVAAEERGRALLRCVEMNDQGKQGGEARE